MRIIETPVFTKRVQLILGDEEYRLLQNHLIDRPEAVKVIPSSGGLRKLRWAGSGRGKRSGSRVIHYFLKNDDSLLMLLIYRKSESENLTQKQIKVLKSMVDGEIS